LKGITFICKKNKIHG